MSLHLDTFERIALIKPSALGDIAHALPVLHALRVRYPKAHITWIVNRAYEPLLADHPDLNATLPFDRGAGKRGWIAGAASFYGLLAHLRRERFDLAIDLQGLLRTGLMCWATGARRKLGLGAAREGARWFYTDVLTPPDASAPQDEFRYHAVDRYWMVAQAVGAADVPKRFHLPVAAPAREWAEQRLRPHPRPWVMINLGTRWETKRWPTASFSALFQQVHTRFGGTAILVGGADEQPLARAFLDHIPTATLDLTGQSTLLQLVAVLARSDLVVSNDSGPLHLAVALGRPVVAPYTCTSPTRTGPYGQPDAAVLTEVACRCSYIKKCPRMICMSELTPQRLWPLVEARLQTWQRQSA
jgi:lipopolysaccharide heptosyltransferase II